MPVLYATRMLRNDQDAVELIGEALSQGAEWIVIPIVCLEADFFRLSTGVAGRILQKFVTYRRRVVILGDISHHIAESSAWNDFVVECNRGDSIRFVENRDDLETRLAQSHESPTRNS
jgi:hypothetical protein